MAFGKQVLVLVVIMAALQIFESAIYKVGDSTRWTAKGYDYNKWASTKTFRVGDTIVFEYNPQFHNVLKVSYPQYQSWNASSPIVEIITDNVSIPIKKTGHFYYICGFPGHCEREQKVHIQVVDDSSSSPSTSPTTAPPPGPSAETYTTLPAQGILGLAALGVAAFFYVGLANMEQNPPDSTDKGLYSHGHYSSSHSAGYGHHSAGHHNAGFPPSAYLFSSHSPHYGANIGHGSGMGEMSGGGAGGYGAHQLSHGSHGHGGYGQGGYAHGNYGHGYGHRGKFNHGSGHHGKFNHGNFRKHGNFGHHEKFL